MRRHNQLGLEFGQVRADPRNQRLEQRSVQVKPTKEPVDLRRAGECEGIARNIHDTRVAAAGDNHESAVADVDDHRLIIEHQGVRFPVVISPGFLDWKARLVAGGPVNFAGDKDRIVKQETNEASLRPPSLFR